MGKKIHIRIRDGDQARLERICDEMGVSKAGAVRAAIVALSRQLGFDKEIPPDLLKK